mmetsp:Transcript_30335/g.66397  ORF Transcript_30335/g.66397 Transcript_30335/m.66397 type:complete len:621 (-) Transcript_30335:944-2806(-)
MPSVCSRSGFSSRIRLTATLQRWQRCVKFPTNQQGKEVNVTPVRRVYIADVTHAKAVEGEEGRAADLLIAAEAAANALRGPRIEEPEHQLFCDLVHLRRETKIACHHCCYHLACVLEVVAEGKVATDQLVEHHAQRPDIHSHAIAPRPHHLRRHVVRRADHCEGALLGSIQLLCDTEVYQFQVSVRVQHDILGLQITVNDVPRTERLQHECQGADVEHGLGSCQGGVDGADGSMQLSPADKLRQQVDAARGLERLDNSHYKRVVCLRQCLYLAADLVGYHAVDLLLLLQRIPEARVLWPGQHDDTGCPGTNDVEGLEIPQRDASVLRGDSADHLLSGVAPRSDDLAEGLPIDRPDLSLGVSHISHRCGARPVEEGSTLTEAAVLGIPADESPVDESAHFSLGDHVEVCARLPLHHDVLALGAKPRRRGVNQYAEMASGKMPKYAHLRHGIEHPLVLAVRIRAPAAGNAVELSRSVPNGPDLVNREDGNATALRAGDEVASLRVRRKTRLAVLLGQGRSSSQAAPMSAADNLHLWILHDLETSIHKDEDARWISWLPDRGAGEEFLEVHGSRCCEPLNRSPTAERTCPVQSLHEEVLKKTNGLQVYTEAQHGAKSSQVQPE